MNRRGEVAIVGIGESGYFKRGDATTSEFELAVEAITRATQDAGIELNQLDGFATYGDERNDPVRLGAALGVDEVRFSNKVWPGGGGGCVGAVGNAGAAVLAGLADHVVVYRALAQGQYRRYGEPRPLQDVPELALAGFPHGVMAPAQMVALRTTAFMHRYNIGHDALAAISLASYGHAQRNPRAVMYGKPLTRDRYYASRWIAEPFRLFDCCQETDGASAVIVTSLDRAKDLPKPPVVIAAAAQGQSHRYQPSDYSNSTNMGIANQQSIARRMFASAGLTPSDIDVAQIYDHFTGGVMMSLVEYGFCRPEEAGSFMTEQNFSWDGGQLPLNTGGGNLAEVYTHGLALVNEGARQMRGESTSQADHARTCLVTGGAGSAPSSGLILTRDVVS